MKILGKDVVVGTKKICMEYISRIQGGFSDSFVGYTDYKGDDLEKDVLFIRDKKGYFVELKELGSHPTFSLICFGAATRWKTSPRHAGDYYIDDIKPYFEKYDQNTLFDLKQLVHTAKVYSTEEYQSTLTNN